MVHQQLLQAYRLVGAVGERCGVCVALEARRAWGEGVGAVHAHPHTRHSARRPARPPRLCTPSPLSRPHLPTLVVYSAPPSPPLAPQGTVKSATYVWWRLAVPTGSLHSQKRLAAAAFHLSASPRAAWGSLLRSFWHGMAVFTLESEEAGGPT